MLEAGGRRLPESMHMTRQKLRQMIELGVRKLQDPYYQGAAAELAFYFVLSIVPLFILLSQFLGVFSTSLDSIRDWLNLEAIAAEGAGEMLLSMLDYRPSGFNSVFLALAAIWSASRAQFSLMRISNYTMTCGRSTGEGYLRDRIRSLKTVIITVLTIGSALIILVYAEPLLKLVFGVVQGAAMVEKTWVFIRWPIAAMLYFLMISYNYYILPTRRVPFRMVVPGGIFASIGFLVVTVVFRLYTDHSSSYDILYGSFSNIVALLIWFFFLSWVMFLGVILNKVWDEVMRGGAGERADDGAKDDFAGESGDVWRRLLPDFKARKKGGAAPDGKSWAAQAAGGEQPEGAQPDDVQTDGKQPDAGESGGECAEGRSDAKNSGESQRGVGQPASSQQPDGERTAVEGFDGSRHDEAQSGCEQAAGRAYDAESETGKAGGTLVADGQPGAGQFGAEKPAVALAAKEQSGAGQSYRAQGDRVGVGRPDGGRG